MKLLFAARKVFVHGGLGRDLVRIASECARRGHEVAVCTARWEGAASDGLRVVEVPESGWTIPAAWRAFERGLRDRVEVERPDLLVGFQRMPGLDVYYAADTCLRRELAKRPLWHRATPRNRLYGRYERAIFGPGSRTEVLLISEREREIYRSVYGTEEERLHLLPPGVDPSRRRPHDAPAVRQRLRDELGIAAEEVVLLSIGTNFRLKGIDRSLRAIAALPAGTRARLRYLVAGKDRPARWRRLAARLGIAGCVDLLGIRDDIPELLWSADLLLHAARRENTGTVIAEALVAGLPAVVTDVCGYAPHVERSGGGAVVPSPFSQDALDRELLAALEPARRARWSEAALEYARRTDLESLPERAADLVEELALARSRS